MLIDLKKINEQSPDNFKQAHKFKPEGFLCKSLNKKDFWNKKLVLDSTLLDYIFKFVLSPVESSYKAKEVITAFNSSNFSFKTFFPTDFCSFPLTKNVPDFLTQETGKLDFLFNKPSEIFKNICLELPRNVTKYSWEVLPIYLLPDQDRDYLEPNAKKHLRTNFLTDSKENQQNFSLLKTNILKLNKTAKPVINRTSKSFNAATKDSVIKYTYNTDYNRVLNGIEPGFNIVGPILPEKSELKHEFKQDRNSRFLTHYDIENYVATDLKAPEWFVQTPVIYCLPFHCQIDMLAKPQAQNESGTIISFTPTVYDETDKHSLGFNTYAYKINHCEPEIPAKIPHRNHIFEVTLPSDKDKYVIENIKLPQKKIQKQKETTFRAKSNTKKEKHKIENNIPELAKSYPLYKPLFNIPKTNPTAEIEFSITPPSPINELYKHLLHYLNLRLKAQQKLFFHPLTIKPISFELKHAPLNLRYEERAFFVRRILSCKQKIGNEIDRKAFTIADLSYKDLLNLATQTNKKFKSLNYKNSS